MDDVRHDGDAGVASPNQASNSANDTNANGVASDAKVTALDDGLKYTLTALEAMERFIKAGRKAPSLRSMQRYCDEGTIRGTKIKTTFGQEWLINEESLTKYIDSLPIETVVGGDAGVASVANQPPSPEKPLGSPPATNDNGVASVANEREVATPPGETRTLATVLIENAKLLARIEGKDEVLNERSILVTELRDDRKFLREELTEARKLRGDVKEIAQKMLDTLGAMSLASIGLKQGKTEPQAAEIINQEGESRPA
jgi:hypothetical protein